MTSTISSTLFPPFNRTVSLENLTMLHLLRLTLLNQDLFVNSEDMIFVQTLILLFFLQQ